MSPAESSPGRSAPKVCPATTTFPNASTPTEVASSWAGEPNCWVQRRVPSPAYIRTKASLSPAKGSPGVAPRMLPTTITFPAPSSLTDVAMAFTLEPRSRVHNSVPSPV
jgi:hypothetical protein